MELPSHPKCLSYLILIPKLSEGYIENWADVLRAAWEDFTFALPNCESGAACQERVKRCIEKLVVKHPGRNLLMSSHGNAIGLYLHMMDSSYGYEEWAAMRNPDLFRILYRDGVPAWDTGFVYDEHIPSSN